jgi:hypothetical protein
MRLALGHSVEWDKVYALIIFNSETTKRQSRFANGKARIGEGKRSVRTCRQTEWALYRNSGSAGLAGICIARTCRAWPSADG